MKKINEKEGMSLIVLTITIIVMFILSGVIIVGLSDNNPISKANRAKFETDFANYKEELSAYLVNRLYEDYKFNPETIEAKAEDMKKYISSMNEQYYNEFEIVKGELIYIGTSDQGLAEEVYSQGLVAYFSPLTPPEYDEIGNYWYWPITLIGQQQACSIKGAKICGWNFPAGVEEKYKNGEFSTFNGSAGATYKSGYDPEKKSYNLDGTNDYMVIDNDMILDVSRERKTASKITNITADKSFTMSVTAIAKKFGVTSKILVQRPNVTNYNFIGFTTNSLGKLAPYLGACNGMTTDLKGAVKVSVANFNVNSFVKVTASLNGKENNLYINGRKANTEVYNAQALDVNTQPAYWNIGRQHTEDSNNASQYAALELKTITFWEDTLDSSTIYQNYKTEKVMEE